MCIYILAKYVLGMDKGSFGCLEILGEVVFETWGKVLLQQISGKESS